MNRSKRLLCAVLACMVACAIGCAEEGDTEVTVTPTPAVETPEPTIVPTETTAPEPTDEPTETPTPDSTDEPTEAPTGEPTDEPTEAPTPDSTDEPTEAPTEKPTDKPTEAPAEKPTDAPSEKPELPVEIIVTGNAQLVENVWQITMQSPEERIEFQWEPVESAAVYEVRITDGQATEIHLSQEIEPTLSLPASGFGADTYAITVTAYQMKESEQETVLIELKQLEAMFALVQQTVPGGFGGGGFGGFGGGGFRGSFGGGSFSGGASVQGGVMPEAAQGFRITPGEALTDTHASGSRNMTVYGAVEVDPSEDAMTLLTLDGAELDVTLDDRNGSFFAVREENTLILTPESGGETWSVSAFALKTLGRSGIASVRLMLGGGAVELSTEWNLQGAEYARLSADGYVSKDYTLTVTLDKTQVAVAGGTYTINENNELVGG